MVTIQKLETVHKRLCDIYPSMYVQHKSNAEVGEQQEKLIKELVEELGRLEADQKILTDIVEARGDLEQLNNRIYQIKGYLHLVGGIKKYHQRFKDKTLQFLMKEDREIPKKEIIASIGKDVTNELWELLREGEVYTRKGRWKAIR